MLKVSTAACGPQNQVCKTGDVDFAYLLLPFNGLYLILIQFRDHICPFIIEVVSYVFIYYMEVLPFLKLLLLITAASAFQISGTTIAVRTISTMLLEVKTTTR